MHNIPKIIHQTWKDPDLHSPLKELAQTWRKYLPDWDYILWTDEMNRKFVANYFPQFLAKYDSYPRNIQRADAIRYLLLKVYGGLYVDLDFECFENIEFLFDGADFIAGKEPHWHAERADTDFIICNALMASTPNHPFIDKVCDKLMNFAPVEVNEQWDVLTTTGPLMLTDSYREFEEKETIRLLEPETIYPIGIFEVNQIFNNEIPTKMKEAINRAYAIHYFLGNW